MLSLKFLYEYLWERRQHGRVVSESDSQSSSPLFGSCSGHLLDLFSVVLSSKPGYPYNLPTGCLLQVGDYLFGLSFSNQYLSEVLVHWLDKILSTIDKPLPCIVRPKRDNLLHFSSYKAGCKESQFYSLPFGQAVASMYWPTSHFN